MMARVHFTAMPPFDNRHQWRLDQHDPLYSHLGKEVLPSCGLNPTCADFRVICLSARQAVYLYREEKTCAMLVCKFFGNRSDLSDQNRRELLNHEYQSLHSVRGLGFSAPPHRVVRPLSKHEGINFLLVEEFAEGRDLDYYVAKAAHQGEHGRLSRKLGKLARFLAALHNGTAGPERTDFLATISRFKGILDSLIRDRCMDQPLVLRFHELCRRWEQDPAMWSDVLVTVHGDATPTNFIFHPQEGVTAIDLERMHRADRAYDLGMLAAELKHHFAWRILDARGAEPFIDHLLRSYCEPFPDPESAFRAVTHRNRFYMALGELRIARNAWLNHSHRKWLIHEALRCLCP